MTGEYFKQVTGRDVSEFSSREEIEKAVENAKGMTLQVKKICMKKINEEMNRMVERDKRHDIGRKQEIPKKEIR